jgi:Family of unknown function (DUF5372)
MSGCPEPTTPSSQSSLGFVTVTHPHHPLRGQRVEIIRLRRGADPDLIVRFPDGRHAAIALSSTDYAATLDDTTGSAPQHLLDLAGLRQVVQLLDQIARRGRSTPSDGDPTGTKRRRSR